jgi:hypothetical protein
VRWQPNIGEETATGKVANENELEGRIKKLTGYTIRAEGNFILPEGAGRIRFELDARFAANNEWTEWSVKGLQRPNVWTISANRKEQMIELGLGEGAAAVKQKFRFSDFQNPGKLMNDLGVAALPMAGAVLPNLMSAPGSTNAPALALGLRWEGKQVWLQLGHSRVMVYELSALVFE